MDRLLGDLRRRGVTHVHCCGLALDVCVAFTALHAAEEGFVTSCIEVWRFHWPAAAWGDMPADVTDVIGVLHVIGDTGVTGVTGDTGVTSRAQDACRGVSEEGIASQKKLMADAGVRIVRSADVAAMVARSTMEEKIVAARHA